MAGEKESQKNIGREEKISKGEAIGYIQNQASQITLTQRAQISFTKELQRAANFKSLRMNGDVFTLCIRYAALDDREGLEKYLVDVGVDEKLRDLIIKDGGVYDKVRAAYLKNALVIVASEAAKHYYTGNYDAAKLYIEVYTTNKDKFAKAGLNDDDFNKAAKNSEYGQKMNKNEWEGFCRFTVSIIQSITITATPTKYYDTIVQSRLNELARLSRTEIEEYVKKYAEKKEIERIEKMLRYEYYEHDGSSKIITKDIEELARKTGKSTDSIIEAVLKQNAEIIAAVAAETKVNIDKILNDNAIMTKVSKIANKR
jgi:hypothetical protein